MTDNVSSPQDRKIPVNVSMPLRLLDLIDDQSFLQFGTAKGKRSETIVKILKEHLRVP